MNKNLTKISADIIRKQLDRISSSEEMKNSPTLIRFFEFIVNETLDGREDEIKEYTIGIKALGKPSDFNPQLDAVVRIHAGRLRRLITQYYQRTGGNNHLVISLPKGTYVPVFDLPRRMESDQEDPNKPLELAREGLFPLRHPGEQWKATLAVLAFRNLSSDNSHDFFVEGVGEQLATDLARFDNINLLSYFSTSKHSSDVDHLEELRRKLGVDYVLTGSVRVQDQLIRLNVQLVSTENRFVVWTDNYIRHYDEGNLFDIQEEIVSQVLNVVADENGVVVRLSKLYGEYNSGFKMRKAIYAYYDYTLRYDLTKIEPVIRLLEVALEEETDNVLAMSMLVDVRIDLYLREFKERLSILPQALEMAERAVSLDPYCQYAHRSLAWALILLKNKDKSMEVMDYCIRLNPKASYTVSSLALGYVCIGEYDKGFSSLLYCTHLNPNVSPTVIFAYAIYYFKMENYPAVLKWLDRLPSAKGPISTLLYIAVREKLGQSNGISSEEQYREYLEHSHEILTKMLYDRDLIERIENTLPQEFVKLSSKN